MYVAYVSILIQFSPDFYQVNNSLARCGVDMSTAVLQFTTGIILACLTAKFKTLHWVSFGGRVQQDTTWKNHPMRFSCNTNSVHYFNDRTHLGHHLTRGRYFSSSLCQSPSCGVPSTRKGQFHWNYLLGVHIWGIHEDPLDTSINPETWFERQ